MAIISNSVIKPINRLNNSIVKAVKGIAFGGNNPTRSPKLYTPLEFNALGLFNGFAHSGLMFHEFPLKTKDDKGKTHNYKADLFHITKKVCIEVNPKFHSTYQKVMDSDKRRERLLRQQHNIETININGKCQEEVNKAIKHIQNKLVSKEVLDFYFPKPQIRGII